jgi:hypothetical protein
MGGITIVENSSKQEETKKHSSTLNIPTLTKEKALKFLFHQPPSFSSQTKI